MLEKLLYACVFPFKVVVLITKHMYVWLAAPVAGIVGLPVFLVASTQAHWQCYALIKNQRWSS